MPAKPTKRLPTSTSAASETDWERLRNLADEDIDTSDFPDPTPDEFARAVLRKGLKPVLSKQQVTMRLDADVLAWFRAQGEGYQTRINQLLRAYVDAHRKPEI
jgi:uncharacterized protein (DUF4415 family)